MVVNLVHFTVSRYPIRLRTKMKHSTSTTASRWLSQPVSRPGLRFSFHNSISSSALTHGKTLPKG